MFKIGVSLYECSAGGNCCNHSIEEFNCKGINIFLFIIKASQMIKIKKIILINDTIDPIEEIKFQNK